MSEGRLGVGLGLKGDGRVNYSSHATQMGTSCRPLGQGDPRSSFALGFEHGEGLEASADIVRRHLPLGKLINSII